MKYRLSFVARSSIMGLWAMYGDVLNTLGDERPVTKLLRSGMVRFIRGRYMIASNYPTDNASRRTFARTFQTCPLLWINHVLKSSLSRLFALGYPPRLSHSLALVQSYTKFACLFIVSSITCASKMAFKLCMRKWSCLIFTSCNEWYGLSGRRWRKKKGFTDGARWVSVRCRTRRGQVWLRLTS
jgi:hypothetical protein